MVLISLPPRWVVALACSVLWTVQVYVTTARHVSVASSLAQLREAAHATGSSPLHCAALYEKLRAYAPHHTCAGRSGDQFLPGCACAGVGTRRQLQEWRPQWRCQRFD